MCVLRWLLIRRKHFTGYIFVFALTRFYSGIIVALVFFIVALWSNNTTSAINARELLVSVIMTLVNYSNLDIVSIIAYQLVINNKKPSNCTPVSHWKQHFVRETTPIKGYCYLTVHLLLHNLTFVN